MAINHPGIYLGCKVEGSFELSGERFWHKLNSCSQAEKFEVVQADAVKQLLKMEFDECIKKLLGYVSL